MTHSQNTAFKARFDSLGSKFNGKTLDDYVNSKSFCCSDNSLDEIETPPNAENAKLGDNLYFYHPDHLGSTNLITNFDGEVTQSVAYVPYGEVFVEERNGIGLRLSFSMLRNLMRRLDCIIMGRGIWSLLCIKVKQGDNTYTNKSFLTKQQEI